MSRTAQNRSAYQLLFSIVMASALALVGLAGCGSTGDTPSSPQGGTSGHEEASEPPSFSDSDGQTAPMPDHVIQESEIIGCWSPDASAQQPIFIDFYYQDGRLLYDYYQILLGDGSGIGLANGHSKFEYNSGDVVFYGNQGTCQCLVGGGNKVYIAFYLDSIADGLIVDQEDGDEFYYVGAECPFSEGRTKPTYHPSSPSGSSSSSSISSADEAIDFLYNLLVDGGHDVPPYMEFDHMSGDGYVIHGYEVVDDGGGSHTGTWFWYTVYPDGTVYDEILQTEVSL